MLTDLRLALKSLARTPSYAAAVVVLLALGLGSAVAVVSVVDQVMLRPLPFPRSDRVFSLFETTRTGDARLASYPTARDWLEQSRVFDGLSYVYGDQLAVRGPAGVELMTAAYPSGDFFRLLGMPALLGRTLTAEDDRRGERVAVLSYRVWQEHFAGES